MAAVPRSVIVRPGRCGFIRDTSGDCDGVQVPVAWRVPPDALDPVYSGITLLVGAALFGIGLLFFHSLSSSLLSSFSEWLRFSLEWLRSSLEWPRPPSEQLRHSALLVRLPR